MENHSHGNPPTWYGTTILSVRKNGKVVIAGDGQVSMGQTVMKPNAKKVRQLHDGSVIGGFAAAKTGVLNEYQVNRLQSFVDPNADTQGTGYQLRQARITVGSGGLIGTGLFNGPQTNGRFVPEQQTDFIFTVAGEELGFLGSGLIILLYIIILMRAFSIARRTNDPFGRLVGTGVIAWFAFQIFENIGMTLGLMPMTGVPLPFLSYGGSSMFANLIGFGLLQNIHAKQR
jgi:rod shape determining protein RodA